MSLQNLEARDLFSQWGWDTELEGSFKSIFAYQRFRQQGVFSHDDQFQTEQRLRLQGVLSRDWFRFEIADEISFIHKTPNDPLVQVPDFSPLPAWDTRWNIVDTSNLTLVNRIDKVLAQINLRDIEISVGKQIVPAGVGHLFSAISQTPRHPFIKVDPEYSVTEDALSFTWNGSLALEARFLPKVDGQKQHNFHLRAKGSKMRTDVAVTTGRSDDKFYMGIEAAGNLGDSLLRGELAYYDEAGTGYTQALLGYDNAFNSQWSGEFELFYNGFGKESSYLLESFKHRSAPYRGQWYFGTRIRWDISELFSSNFIVITNLLDPSGLVQLNINYSLSSSLDLMVGQFLNIAKDASSEFGGQLPAGNGLTLGLPNMTFLLFKYYF